MLDSLKKVILAGLGAASVSREKLQAVVDGLVCRGELSREQAERLIEELLAGMRTETRSLADRLAREVLRLLDRSPFASRRELHRLERRVRALEGALSQGAPDEVEPSRSPGSAPGPECAAEDPHGAGADTTGTAR